jgi:hypothetical protein
MKLVSLVRADGTMSLAVRVKRGFDYVQTRRTRWPGELGHNSWAVSPAASLHWIVTATGFPNSP